jgi:nitrogen fixation protein FixH
MISIFLFVLLSLALTWSGLVVRQYVALERHEHRRSERIQAREWALGAQALEPGQRLQQGAWTLRHEADRLVAESATLRCELMLRAGRISGERFEVLP